MVKACRTGNLEVLKAVSQAVVTADFIFTSPAVIVQMVTGYLLMAQLHIPFTSTWFVLVASLFCFVGAFWLPVVWMQIKMHRLIEHLPHGTAIPPEFNHIAYRWERMGYPAGVAMIALFVLMVYKPFMFQ
jgi:uncharacterized membrane protein